MCMQKFICWIGRCLDHGHLFVLCLTSCVLLLCQGCSSETTARSSAPVNVGLEQTSAEQVSDTQHGETASGPHLVLEKTTYDFGEIKPMSKKTAVFDLRNAGDAVLRITDVKRCCGVVVQVDKKELGVGETGTLSVGYRAGQWAGALTKKVALLTNDPQNARVELTVTGKVVRTLAWEPARFKLSTGKSTAACPDITIRSLDGTPFSIKRFTATGQCLAAEFDPSRQEEQFTLKPVVDTAKLKTLAGSRGRLGIELDHPDYKMIYLAFDVVAAFEVIPRQIVAFDAEPNEPLVRTVQFRLHEADSGGSTAFEVESVTSGNGTRAEVRSVTRVGDGCEIRLAIWPARDEAEKSFSSDQLLIKMKDGPKLNVPVRIFYSPRAVSAAKSPASNL